MPDLYVCVREKMRYTLLMLRPWYVFCWILLGALAAGTGIGIFLHQSNVERLTLQRQTAQAKEEASQVVTRAEQVTQEANKRLEEAQKQIAKLQEERDLLSRSRPFPEPNPRLLKTWRHTASLPLGISLRIPSSYQATTGTDVTIMVPQIKAPFLTLQPWDDRNADAMINGAATSSVLYRKDALLFKGQKYIGTGGDGAHSWTLFRLERTGSDALMIFIQPTSNAQEDLALSILSTLTLSEP
jgi:ElaB/YqjD/DUF883 family membrane-anchored ribosome-binding protein